MAVPISEQRKLFQRSGDMCAFPGCRAALTAEASGADRLVALGEMAHIVADGPNGPRGASVLKINDLSELVDGTRPALTDPAAAGYRLGVLLARRAPALLVVDDVHLDTPVTALAADGDTLLVGTARGLAGLRLQPPAP
ncbi:hypothetical protein OHA72_35285 [Dactylosporangium sp. NBC_01737]|uniref:hypothetical protein n=1 Tax=Dactylosporangium sp. NBC_01737 TaxID=2975959 RepID=UPI002E1374EA|nr:hypothetical protein OHA72_35285 [Dactylosporangium sp. NBC_01737]